MINRISRLLPIVLMLACTNETGTADPGNTKEADGHALHTMTATNNYCDSVNNGLIREDTLKGSPHRTAMATINGTHVHIKYNSPGVKGRTIWGGLVAYDKVWATGAHKATTIQFNKDIEINGKKITAGQYAFFTIPGKDKWIALLNTRFDQHLADDYNEKEDVVRLELVPQDHAMTQRLTYLVNKLNDKSGEIVMQWEKKQIRVPFTTL